MGNLPSFILIVVIAVAVVVVSPVKEDIGGRFFSQLLKGAGAYGKAQW
ncbi:MAG: hypothetical protein ISS93_03735, partial [Candidatus Aenigmarchaeota archaeon]|nr:hypothetical protein [Candidatus Aenigmarchaeota archaeon]